MSEPMCDERGQVVETFTATAAKNAFGTVLEKGGVSASVLVLHMREGWRAASRA